MKMTIDDVYSSNSKFLKAADLKKQDGTFAKVNVTIAGFDVAEQDDHKKQIVLSFEGKDKILGLNKINAERISMHVGSRSPEDWTGWTIRLYVEKVQNPAGAMVDGIRVSAEWAEEPKGKAAAAAVAVTPPSHRANGFGSDDEDMSVPF